MSADRLARLSEADLAALRRTLEAYEGAELGRLNATADELRRLCGALGWAPGGGVGPRQWARRVLGLGGPRA